MSLEEAAAQREKAAVDPARYLTPEEVEDLRAESVASGERMLALFRAEMEQEAATPTAAE